MRLRRITVFSLFFFMLGGFYAFDNLSIQEDASLYPKADSEAVLSPVSGTWANYQSLVLDVPKDAIALYSFTGDDPLEFGFAYDGPVRIEKEGEVDLRIAFVYADDTVLETQVSYRVVLPGVLSLGEEGAFLNQNQPFIRASADNPLKIPSDFLYSLDDDRLPYARGRTLFLAENTYERYLPLLVAVDGQVYRWMLFLEKSDESSTEKKPSETRAFSTKLSLSNPDFLFRLSDRPESPLVQSLFISVLEGEFFSKRISIDVYDGNEFIGSLEKTISVNRSLPKKPEFISSTKSFYSREAVKLKLSHNETFFYLVDEPEILHFDDKTASYQIAEKKEPTLTELRSGYKTKGLEIEFPTHSEAVLYRIYAIAEDSEGNLSDIASYECIVDANQYYIDPRKKTEQSAKNPFYPADGSPDFPFLSLEDALKKLSNKNGIDLHLLGNDVIQNTLQINQDFSLIGHNDAELQLGSDVYFEVRDAKLSFESVFFTSDFQKNSKQSKEKISSLAFQKSLFSLSDAQVLFENCDFSFFHPGNFVLAQARNSRLDFYNTSFVLDANREAGFISLVDSECNVISSNIVLSAPRGLMFSLIGGALNLYESKFSLFGENFRVADLLHAQYFFVGNEFFQSPAPANVLGMTASPMREIPEDLFYIDFSSKQKAVVDNTLIKKDLE